MHLPDQELFSIEDVAARWGKSVTYVQDLTRRRLLPMNRALTSIKRNSDGKPSMSMKCFVTRQDLEQFEKTHGRSQGQWLHLKQAAALLDMSVKTLRSRLKEEDEKVEAGLLQEEDRKFKYTRDGKRILVFIDTDYFSK